MYRDCAVLEALDLYKQPAKVRALSRTDLPPDMLTLIKIAAGDEATIQLWAGSTKETPDDIRQAAVFFLQQTIAKSGNDASRVLGLPRGASREDARLHKRWLLKWLHPDRNPSKWETALFHRVSAVADSFTVEPAALAPQLLSNVSEKAIRPRRSSSGRSHGHGQSHLQPLTRQVDWRGLWMRLIRRFVVILAVLGIAVLFAMVLRGLWQDDLRSLASLHRVNGAGLAQVGLAA